ncbi:hypothetical protein G7047_30400 (plasmid) [Diaphorobacter sp. HDW4A]|jgi:hypothetical protein|uniref:hypothetical protein n=1 Tax=Diaphorobacter sp. HDW4A TaxID=2714924 RepID=UPI00140A1B91|nr:hypothetical protein [Diaphorobacter sp. HDW4A]QIL84332.1 hypothetical protein G7047_30400 [Diaphorobacter sp. HDW4A]
MIIRPINADHLYPGVEDFELDRQMERDKRNFESTENWIYLGADIRDIFYSKVGITTGNLQSRSYSSAMPNYYLFCAFKAEIPTSKARLELVENDILANLDNQFGQQFRMCHAESGTLSECYYGVEFKYIFQAVHQIIYYRHPNAFTRILCEDDYGNAIGSRVRCEFNEVVVKNKKYWESLILQAD